MAFGFFRRRQKMVMIIMAVLMVSFLIGFQGFEMITQQSKNPVEGTIGGSRKIRASDLDAARSALFIQERLGLGNQTGMLAVKGQDKALAYALLMQEADRNGVAVSDADADRQLDVLRTGLNPSQPTFPDVESYLRSVSPDLNVQQARFAIKGLMAMERNLELSAPTVPPSEATVRELYRDLAEMVNLWVVPVRADEFMAGVKEPSQADVQAQFDKYRDVLPGGITKDNPFGYGYKIPDQAAVQYMLINQETVTRATRPSKLQVQTYYNDPKYGYKGLKAFSDVRDEIEKTLRPQEVQKRLSALQDFMETQASTLAAAHANPYIEIRKDMERDAAGLLNTELDKDLAFEGKLSDVVDQVARAANLDGICFPYGQVGDLNIQQDKIRVRVVNAATVREALDQISVQVSGAAAETQPATTTAPAGSKPASQPVRSNLRLRWVTAQFFERSLFPQGEGTDDIFPVNAGQTSLMDQTAMESFFLGSAHTQDDPKNTLAKIVFEAQAFKPENVAGMPAGANGPRLVMSQRGFGQEPANYMMVWRLWKTFAAHVPTDQELASNSELRQRVNEDLRTGAAYRLALKRAEELKAAAGKVGLQQIAGDMHLSARPTGLISRKVDQADQAADMLIRMQMPPDQLAKKTPAERQQMKEYTKAQMGYTMQIEWRGLPNEPYPDMFLRMLPESDARRKISENQEVRKGLTEAAFALANTNNVGVAQVQAAGTILVLQPMEYRPPVKSEYEKGNPQLDLPSKTDLANRMIIQQIEQFRQGYFELQNIKDRLGFVAAK